MSASEYSCFRHGDYMPTCPKCAVERDPFLRYRDSITEVLRYASDKAASGDHGVEIAEMATGLLGDLGVE